MTARATRLSVILSAALILAPGLFAHAISISTGELRVNGATAVYQLRIPIYEVSNMANPATALLDHVRFTGATRISSECHADQEEYTCTAHYSFSPGTGHVKVECTLFQITVPNHVHLLTITAGTNRDQQVFDNGVSQIDIRFQPPTRAEALLRDLGEGMSRAISSPAALFLLGLLIAARSRRDAVNLTAAYVAAEWMMRAIGPQIPIPLSPRFIEATMALSVAYLAIEIAMLPGAGKRWIVVSVLGLFHGLYFSPFPVAYLAGASILQIAVIGLLIAIARQWPTGKQRRPAAIVLAICGTAWFVSTFF